MTALSQLAWAHLKAVAPDPAGFRTFPHVDSLTVDPKVYDRVLATPMPITYSWTHDAKGIAMARHRGGSCRHHFRAP
jgi:hypothetical protein